MSMSTPTPHVPLPSLPASPDDSMPGGRTIVDLLTDAHNLLGGLCDRLEEHDTDAPSAVTDALVAELSRHLSAEEQYLYPSIRALAPDGDAIADREIAGDLVLQHALKRLSGASGDGFRHALADVAGGLRDHVSRCEHEMFPQITAMVPAADQVRLGNRVSIALEAAPTRPHPSTPMTPPLNKITDPVVAVVDKARDVLGHRTTYARDLPA